MGELGKDCCWIGDPCPEHNPTLQDQIDALKAENEALRAACEEFVRKVECGEARSVRSYKQMKEALEKGRK